MSALPLAMLWHCANQAYRLQNACAGVRAAGQAVSQQAFSLERTMIQAASEL